MTEVVSTGKVTHVEHPLVQHKLSYLRDKETPTVHFRKLVNEVTLLLTYEATQDFPTETVEIETPLERMEAQRISGKKVAICPVLRAGLGMLEGVLSLISSARVGFIGLYRDEETLEPVEYYVKLPDDLAERDAIVLDPMLATGNSSAAAIEAVKDAGARSVTLVCIVAAPRGIERVHERAPGRPHRLRGDRPRAEREGLHRPGPRRRRRPALRHEVTWARWTRCATIPRSSTALALALLIVILLTPAVGGMARILGAVDRPGGRRLNVNPGASARRPRDLLRDLRARPRLPRARARDARACCSAPPSPPSSA